MDIDSRVKKLVDEMTLEEKAGMCSGGDFWHTKAVERLSIAKIVLTDGPHGLRKQEGEADHLGLNASVPATCFPAGATAANSWDEALISNMAALIAEEAAAEGVSVVLGPAINIKRNPLCGRNFEYYAEDPFLAGKLAAAYVRGMQKNGVAACPKHFAVNNQERLRMVVDAVIDERALREIYLLPFEYAVKEGGAKVIMSSYNKVNGIYASENAHLLQEILREEWGFNGVVVTDWGASNDRVQGLICGNDLEMPPTMGETDLEIIKAVRAGKVSEALLNERVCNVLKLVLATSGALESRKEYSREEHHRLACEIAEQSMVLLKNEGVLPLKSGEKIAIIGDFAKTARYQGAGSSIIHPTKIEAALDVFKASAVNFVGFEEGFQRFGEKSVKKTARAVELAKTADTILLFLGLDESSEAEGLDRENIWLPQNQLDLLDELVKVNKNIVVVLSGGAPVQMAWDEKVKAVLHGYLGGQAGGQAIFHILTGKVNPSGKLAETYGKAYGDGSSTKYFPGEGKTTEHRESIFVGYRHFDKAGIEPKYPFGYGLSYTSFAYSNLNIEGNSITFALQNTGKTDGGEICQVYVEALESVVFRAKRELKGFQKVFLRAGERAEVSITLDEKAFSFYSVKEKRWVTEQGRYEIAVGASSRNLPLRQQLFVAGEMVQSPYDESLLPSYYAGTAADVSEAEFAALIGKQLPAAAWNVNEAIGLNSSIEEAALHRGLGRAFYKLINFLIYCTKHNVKTNSALKAAKQMPFRSMVTMTDGMFNGPMVDGILTMVNGPFWGGLKQFCKAWRGKRK